MRGSTFLATTVLAGVLLAAAAAPTGAAGATLYVSGSLGTDAGNCTTLGSPCRTIGYAVQQAGTAAATIEVTTGTYTSSGADVVSVGPGQDVTLLGGWEATFTNRVGGSTISGGTVRRAISVAGGSLTLSRFTVSGGSATAGGGLLAGSGGTARIVESTFEQNSSTGDGGAIAVEGGSVALVDSTVATNHADGAGAGVYVSGAGSVLRASNATIASNSATSGGGIAVAGTANEAVFLADTLIGGNTGGPGGECATAGTSSLTSLGYNAIGSTIGCAVAAQTGDQFDIQLFLLPLGAYGGPTDTEPLQTKSPLVDAGNPAGCRDDRNALLTTDQRGEPRPATAFDACDIGAYELGVPANDDFASAQALPSSGGQATGTNIHASLESGEPEHAGDEGGASVWYSWTAPSSGDYQVDTSGSDFDTLLGVYEGPDVAHLFLPPVAQNDDASDTTSTSRACFPATAGHTYRIAVDGFGGDTGTIEVRVQPKPDATPCPIRPPLVTPTAPRVGDTVHAGGGVWVDEGAATHQWYRCQAEECDAIDGAVGMDYTVTSDDVGHDLRIDEIENGSISTSDPTGAVGIGVPTPAANGRVFWTTNRDGLDFEIYSMLADGSSVQRLTDRAGQDVEPQPSPDGTQVVFVRGNDIAVMNSDGSNVRDLGVQGAFPHWSPDGSTIAYVGGNEVHLIDPDGSNDRALAGGASHDLAWSPDASQIAYAAQVGGHDDIAVVGSDGRGLTDLTDTAGTDELSPAWSPDGTQLLFVRGTPSASGQIVVTDPADTSETTLATPGAVVDATWSPDGTKILFSTLDNGNSDLYTIEPDGTGLTRLTSDVAGDELAAWGARVSFPLTVSVGGNGTVSTSPSGSTFADGTTVALTPSPASGWTFAGWTGSCSGTGACTVTMLGPRAVGATFTAVPAPPPPSGGGGGGGGGGGSGGSSGIPPDIHVAVSASASAPPPVGADLLWFVTVSTKNTGGSSDVKLDLTLPAGWTYDHSYADRGPGCVGAPPKLTCDVGFINGSASTNVQLFGKVAQAGDLALTATATSQQEPEFDPSDNTVTLTLRTPSPTPTPIPTPTPAPTPKPKPVPAPRVSGSPVVGATLRAVAPSGSRYRWQLCTVSGCRAIRGATKPTLKLVSSYAHKSVRVAVTRAGRTTYSRKIPVRARAAAR